MDRDNLERAAMGRRNFLKLAGSGSFTAALVAGAGGMLWSSEAAEEMLRVPIALRSVPEAIIRPRLWDEGLPQ